MAVRFSILMPSAEGKAPGGNPFAPDMFDYRSSNTFNFFNVLNPQRRELIEALQEQLEDGKGAAELLGLKGNALEEAVEANLTIYGSPLMAAVERYGQGVLYKATDFDDLPTGAQRRLLENGIILSGLFGLLRPDDLIPMYKLRIDAVVERVGKVSKFWRPHVSPVLNELLQDRVVWNLLPGAHEDAWEDEGTYEAMYRLKFYKEEKGKLKAVTHGVKELRGSLVNFIVRELAEDVEALAEWEPADGYEIDYDHSELAEKGGTIAMISRPGWEQRRRARRKAKAAEEAERRARREADKEADDD